MGPTTEKKFLKKQLKALAQGSSKETPMIALLEASSNYDIAGNLGGKTIRNNSN